jgi:alkanesulfonate monooxygenase SsuD/methylene tetrahydromethanopterin reductase-like flavin-dependent oxidoreductase (luciferase family)
MDVGIGLPAMVPGVTGKELVDWSRRAEEARFSTLGVLDRLVYPNYEPLIALAAAATVTERIRLTTAVVLLPQRENAALFAKQAATIHHLSGGRLVLGLAPGRREDDYEASGSDFHDRGKRFDAMLAKVEEIWQGREFGTAGGIGPPLDSPPPILIGGQVDAAFRRAARYGAGWIMGGGTPEMLADGREKTRTAWNEAGRDGEPKVAALTYFALGEDADEVARKDLLHYYAWLGDELAGMIADSAAKDEQIVKQYIEAFEQAGCDELIFFPTSTGPEQVGLLAEAALS